MKKFIIAVALVIIGVIIGVMSTKLDTTEIDTANEPVACAAVEATNDLIDTVEDYNDIYYNVVLPAVQEEVSGQGYSDAEVQDIAVLVMYELGY